MRTRAASDWFLALFLFVVAGFIVPFLLNLLLAKVLVMLTFSLTPLQSNLIFPIVGSPILAWAGVRLVAPLSSRLGRNADSRRATVRATALLASYAAVAVLLTITTLILGEIAAQATIGITLGYLLKISTFYIANMRYLDVNMPPGLGDRANVSFG